MTEHSGGRRQHNNQHNGPGRTVAAAEPSIWMQLSENPTKPWSVCSSQSCEPVCRLADERELALGQASLIGWHRCSYRAVV